jgi:hypothetical protein
MTQSIDIYFDPETGEMTVKVDGLPDQECTDLTKMLKEQLGMTDATVTKTEVQYEGGGGSRGESVHRG